MTTNTAPGATTAHLPRATARASITTDHGRRYLLIEDLEGHTIKRTALNGRGTWAEVHNHLAKAGYKARVGFKPLPGAGELRATLIPA